MKTRSNKFGRATQSLENTRWRPDAPPDGTGKLVCPWAHEFDTFPPRGRHTQTSLGVPPRASKMPDGAQMLGRVARANSFARGPSNGRRAASRFFISAVGPGRMVLWIAW